MQQLHGRQLQAQAAGLCVWSSVRQQWVCVPSKLSPLWQMSGPAVLGEQHSGLFTTTANAGSVLSCCTQWTVPGTWSVWYVDASGWNVATQSFGVFG
jgi:hypothetical protein